VTVAVRAAVALGVLLVFAVAIGIWKLGVFPGAGDGQVAAGHRAGELSESAASWKKISDNGVAEEDARQSWPFTAVRRTAMPRALIASSRRVLGDPWPLRLRFDDARFTQTPIGAGLWVVPGRGVICVFMEGIPAGSCATAGEARRLGVVLETFAVDPRTHRPDGYLLLGLAPDGTRVVHARVGGERRQLIVYGNAFAARARSAIRVFAPHRPS
jgi:hypothetical protein